MRKFTTAAALGAAALLAGCEAEIEGAVPAVVIKTDACPRTFDADALKARRLGRVWAPACTSNALALSPDGARVAVAGAKSVELFDTRSGASSVVVAGGADALATGAGLPARLLAQSSAGRTVRVLRFDNGVAAYAGRNIATTAVDNPHLDPFRSNGSALEASDDPKFRAVRAMLTRRKGEMLYSLWTSDERYDHGLKVAAVDDSLTHVAWSREHADPARRLFFMFGRDGGTWAEAHFDKAARWRAFSRDGQAYGAELDGRAAVWDVPTGKVTDRFEGADGVCALAGRSAPQKGKVAIVCADRGAGPTRRLTVWRAPGRVQTGRIDAADGEGIRDWRLSADGLRLAVLEAGPKDADGFAMRLRVIPLEGATGAARTIDLGRVDQPERLAFTLDAAGQTVAVRRPDGRVAIYR